MDYTEANMLLQQQAVGSDVWHSSCIECEQQTYVPKLITMHTHIAGSSRPASVTVIAEYDTHKQSEPGAHQRIER